MLHLLVVGMSLAGQPQIVDPRPTYGHLGALRPKGEGILPGDIASFTFGIKNLKLDDNGVAKYSVGIVIKDSKDKIFYEQKPFNQIAQTIFGGDIIQNSANIGIPLNQPPTDLNWTLTVEDRVSKEKVELKGAGKVLPADFGLVRVGTFSDAESRHPAAPIGVAGETLYLNFSAVGFGRSKDNRPDLNVEMKIFDADKKPTHKPIVANIKSDLPEDAQLIPLTFPLPLNRSGTFTVEVTARCVICNKSATVSIPIRVLTMD